MENNVFLIKWYGPFDCLEDVEDWERKQTFKCSLYLLHGKLKYAKTREKYYCGRTKRKIHERLKDKGHHLEEINERPHSIYVGCLANIDCLDETQQKLAEKIITATLTYIVDDENVLNATNTYFPDKDVYVINEWWKRTGDTVWERQPLNAPSHRVPDVIVCHKNGNNNEVELYGCVKLKRL